MKFEQSSNDPDNLEAVKTMVAQKSNNLMLNS